MNFEGVVRQWDAAARRDDAQAVIHPSGRSASEYSQTGRGQAHEVEMLTAMYAPGAKTALDFGCGDGRVSRWIETLEVVGADSSQAMIDEFLVAVPRDTVGIVWDGCSEWPLAPVDVVFSFAVLIHHSIEDGMALLAGLTLAINANAEDNLLGVGEGGLVLVEIPLYHEPRERTDWCDISVWTLSMFEQAAKAANLTIIEAHENPGAFAYHSIGPNHGRLHVLRYEP